MLTIQCYLDAETLPPEMTNAELENFKLSIKPKGNVKDPLKIAAYQEEYYLEKYAELGKDIDYADFFSLAFSFDTEDDTEDSVSCIYEEGRPNQKEFLEAFYQSVIDEVVARANVESLDEVGLFAVEWVGFNNRHFDMELMWRKAIKHGVYELANLIPRNRYSKSIIDVKEIYIGPRGNTEMFTSQNQVCKYFGIQGKPDDIDGSQVYPYFLKGEYGKIAEYNISDVVTLKRLYRMVRHHSRF